MFEDLLIRLPRLHVAGTVPTCSTCRPLTIFLFFHLNLKNDCCFTNCPSGLPNICVKNGETDIVQRRGKIRVKRLTCFISHVFQRGRVSSFFLDSPNANTKKPYLTTPLFDLKDKCTTEFIVRGRHLNAITRICVLLEIY